MLPPLYEMDDYPSCIENKNIYCKIRANLQSSVNDSEVWEYIKNSIEDKHSFQRNALYRTFCIPKHTAYDNPSIALYSKTLVDKKIEHLNLTSTVDIFGCTDGSISRTFYDYAILTMIILYSCLIAVATFQDIRRTSTEEDDGILQKLSLRYNWRQRTRVSKNVDSKKLKSMQGVRFYTMMFVLLTHTKHWYAFSFIDNPTIFEEWQSLPVLLPIHTMESFMVLVFFMISSWLLTIQIYHINQTHGRITLKDVALLVINRYFRLVVVLTVVILLISTSWMSVFSGANNFEYISCQPLICKRTWYATLFFFNNFIHAPDICVFISWYLSADFQLYVANTLILYVIFKYNLNQINAFSTLLLINSSIYGMTVYIKDLDLVYKTIIRNIEHGDFVSKPEYFYSYSSPCAVWSSSCVGMMLGSLYFRIGDKSLQLNNIWKYLYIPIFLTFPLIATSIASLEFKGIEAAALGILVKLMFSIGIGTGILGMSQNIGGIIKIIFEWKPAILLSNFTYCIYLCQTVFCFMKPLDSVSTFGILKLMKEYIRDALLCIAVAIVFTITVEEPGITIQQKLLPQVNKYGREKQLNDKIEIANNEN